MSRERITVTLDGPAGVGKSTIARETAQALGIAYLDTGAMFRAVAWKLGPQALEWSEERLGAAVAGMVFGLEGSGGSTVLLCDGRPLGADIRGEDVGLLASTLAKRQSVRERLKERQRGLGERFSLVAEGRDMGSVVFPQATHKFFLDATPEVRARRRWLQLKDMGRLEDLAELTEQIRLRDEQDRTRAIAPLRPAEDAVVIDTSALNVEHVLAAVLGRVRGFMSRA